MCTYTPRLTELHLEKKKQLFLAAISFTFLCQLCSFSCFIILNFIICIFITIHTSLKMYSCIICRQLLKTVSPYLGLEKELYRFSVTCKIETHRPVNKSWSGKFPEFISLEWSGPVKIGPRKLSVFQKNFRRSIIQKSHCTHTLLFYSQKECIF